MPYGNLPLGLKTRTIMIIPKNPLHMHTLWRMQYSAVDRMFPAKEGIFIPIPRLTNH
jgi:hypothetical protein